MVETAQAIALFIADWCGLDGDRAPHEDRPADSEG
jgi:hypothetical protein